MTTEISSTLAIFPALACAASAATAPRSATFEARNEFKITVPEGAKKIRLWLAMPQDDPAQKVKGFKVEAPFPHRVTTDSDRERLKEFLAPNTYVVINDRIHTLAKGIVGNEENPVVAARKLYDWELKNIDYWVKDPANKKASPVGSTEYCLNTGSVNCTDFHSLWASLARRRKSGRAS